jgi:peptide/nickel transport system substrate-binding protein
MSASPRRTGSSARIGATLLATAAVVLAACGSSDATPVPTASSGTSSAAASAEASTTASPAGQRGTGGTLTLFYWEAPTILNPHLSPGTKDLSASRITYEPLAAFSAKGDLIPFLAAEIPTLENGDVAADGTSVTWKLKPGIKWSDGEPFTADDVRFTWQYATNPDVGATSASAFAEVADVQVVDPTTVKVVFKSRNPAWSIPFTGPLGMIIPKHVFEPYNGKNAADAPANLKPVGTGPYRVVSFSNEDVLVVGGQAVKTTKTIYEANPYYRDPDKPFFAKVELQGGGGDAVVASQAIETGAVDFAWNLQVDDAETAKIAAAGKGQVLQPLGAFVERIMLNFSDPNKATADGERSSTKFPNPILADRNVRLAIAQAVDRSAIEPLYGTGGEPTDTLLVSPESFRSDHPAPAYDLEAAKRLLDDAGWKDHDGDGIRDKNGVPLKLTYQTSINPVRQQTQAIVQKALRSIGVDVQLKNIDAGVFFGPVDNTTDTRRQFYADLEEFAFSNKSPDPAAYMQAWTCDSIAQKANNWSKPNWSRYCDPAFDTLYQQAQAEIDPARREALFKQMNDKLVDDGAVIPLIHEADVSGASDSLVGLDISPWDLEVWNIADWTRR